MPHPARTAGEAAFEEYLRSQGLTDFVHEKQFPGKNKHPDYSFTFAGAELLFEVKDLKGDPLPLHRNPSNPDEPAMRFGFWDPHAGVRQKIDDAREKFREFKDYPCSLVLFTGGFALLQDPKVMFGAMHGDVGIEMQVDPDAGGAVPGTAREVFGPGGRMTRPHWQTPQNTTINAVIALRRVKIGEKRFVHRYLSRFDDDELIHHLADDVEFDKDEIGLGVVVYENEDAARPLPRDLFTGRFDERWITSADGVKRSYAGEGTRELDELEEQAREMGKTIADAWMKTTPTS